jgi:hypothetical protein
MEWFLNVNLKIDRSIGNLLLGQTFAFVFVENDFT